MRNTDNRTLREVVKQSLESYLSNLGGNEPSNIYQLVIQEIETPLIQTVLKFSKYNQSKAAIILGISRMTLRKKMTELNIDSAPRNDF